MQERVNGKKRNDRKKEKKNNTRAIQRNEDKLKETFNVSRKTMRN